jgi:hypothetical protein
VRTGRNMVKSSSTNMPSIWLIFLFPHTHASPQTCHHSASGILTVWIRCHVITVCVFRKQQIEWNTYNRLRHFLTNKIFLLQVMYRYVCIIFVVKCVTTTHFFIACAMLWQKSIIFMVLSSLETVHDTVQYSYCILSVLNSLLRIRLKHQNSLLS